MSALKTLGNSIKNASTDEQDITCTSCDPYEQDQASLALLKGQPDLTIIHRTRFKNRPSVMFDKDSLEHTLESSFSNISRNSTNDGTVSTYPYYPNKTSSKVTKYPGHLPSKEKLAGLETITNETGFDKYPLETILEGMKFDVKASELTPTFVTVEKTVNAKIYFECHYNNLASTQLAPRSTRKWQLERLLHQNKNMTAFDKELIRLSLANDEYEHLRYTRILKLQSTKALRDHVVIDDKYEVLKVLGKGSFGVVRLVREKCDEPQRKNFELEIGDKKQQVYAMKVIRKSSMIHNSQEGHLRAERDFLIAAEKSRWVVPLVASFQDFSNLYLVMEYMPGGDFLGLLIRENVLSEPVTRWYIAEMILCIEEAHNLRWIHRDIKPDNFLITSSGHLKISDFGLAFDGHWSHDQSYLNNHRYSLLDKLGLRIEGDSIDKKEAEISAAATKATQIIIDQKKRHQIGISNSAQCGGILNWRKKNRNRSFARSIVGTTQYMAPEVVRGEAYDGRCDWWSLAIIIYECLYGHTPFLSEEGGRQQTKLNILNHKAIFNFPQKPAVSKRCQDLIRSIIQEKDKRLCFRRYRSQENLSFHHQNKDYVGHFVYPNDAEEIKAHKWFRDIKWDHLHLMIPPIVPDINSMDDTRYFDEEDSISDFSESMDEVSFTSQDISNALKPFSREIQSVTKGYFERPYDSARLRIIENEINHFILPEDQKKYLLAVVKFYGQKEKKRARDKMLRDKLAGPKIMELRKEGAFLGYTSCRFRPTSKIRSSLRQN